VTSAVNGFGLVQAACHFPAVLLKRLSGVVASKRSTSTGWVFEARTGRQPPSNSPRTRPTPVPDLPQFPVFCLRRLWLGRVFYQSPRTGEAATRTFGESGCREPPGRAVTSRLIRSALCEDSNDLVVLERSGLGQLPLGV